ncbi:hypothetical protein Plec18167_004362 [Paecilomyces lecythidis]|uniref:Methylated-DNA--protein-cysteine methyltransferase n=1 Tax=Paecilomyces lecythidis TaxID=3004212 RepID=A0ABR3XSY3_9EURO
MPSIEAVSSTAEINIPEHRIKKGISEAAILHKTTIPSKITKRSSPSQSLNSSNNRKNQTTSSTSLAATLLIPQSEIPSITKSLHRISSHPTLTPYRRLVYRTLLSVPPGRWTTYAALSAHLNSSARAIGNAMRTNPFAPNVPCHRVLATDRTIGGYKGAWGNGGSYAVEKTKLLKGEGIMFDDKGRAVGECFDGFVDLGEVHLGQKE